jgi:hypothetical protein
MKNDKSKPIKDIQTFISQVYRRKLLKWIINQTVFSLSILLTIYLFWMIFNNQFYMTPLEWKIFPLSFLLSLTPFLFGKPNLSETVDFLEKEIEELKGRLYLIIEPYPSTLDSKVYEKRAIKECSSILKEKNLKMLTPFKYNTGHFVLLGTATLTLIIFYILYGGIKIERISKNPVITYANKKIEENEATLILAESTQLKKMFLFNNEGAQRMINFGNGKFGIMARIKNTSYIQTGYRTWKSKKIKLRVIPSLFINKLTLYYEFPYYLETKSFSDTLYDFEDEILIQALTGTKINFSGVSNLVLREIKSKIKNKSIIDSNFSGSFIINKKEKIEVSLIDTSFFSSCTFNFFIDPIKDEPPSIEFLSPKQEYKLDESSMEVPIILRAEDDYGLSSASLLQGKEKEIKLAVPDQANFYEDSLILKIKNLLTGETLKLRAKATDVAGNTTISPYITIYMPTLEEIFAKYRTLRDTLETYTKDIEEREKEITNRIENFLNKNTMGYKDRYEINKTLKEQKDLIEGMEKLAELSEEIRDPEVAREIDRIKELIDDKQLKDFMTNLNKMTENPEINPESLKQLNADQKDLLKKLELFKKSLEYLKKLLELNEFSRRAEEIYKKQQEITSSEPDYYKSQIERELAKELESLIQDMEKSTNEKIKNIAYDFKNTKTAEDMEKLAGIMEKGNTSKKIAEKIEQNLRNLNASLKNTRESNAGEALAEIIREKGWELGFILRTHNNLIDMKPSMEKGLIEQSLLEALEKIERDLKNLFLRSLSFSPEVFTDIKRAKEKLKSLSLELTKKDVPKSTMKRVNDPLIQAIIKLFSAPPPSSESLASALREIIEQQNSIMNGLGKMMPIPVPNPKNKGILQNLSQKQRQLAEDLRQMGKAFEPLSSEMEEMANNLERGMLDKNLIERQQKVLDRLLEAESAIREGDVSRKRRSEPGIYVSPGKISLPENLGEEKKTLRELLEKRIKEPYPEEYKKEIEKYFRKLTE